MNNADSVKARLKNVAKSSGRLYHDALVMFGLERTIYRISVSKYASHFILKGGVLLYAVIGHDFTRNTTDIDLLAQSIDNDIDGMMHIFTDIFTIKTEDPLVYDLTSLKTKTITEFQDYHGINVSVFAYLDKTRIPISIDIGYGDIVFPGKMEIVYPTLLDMTPPSINAYPLVTVLAEKFEIIVSLGYGNSRYKDYFDIYELIHHDNYCGSELKEAIKRTFAQRKTGFDDIVVFEDDFWFDPTRQGRWNTFIKKKKAITSVDFKTMGSSIKAFFQPIVNHIQNAEAFDLMWKSEEEQWE